MIPVKPALSYFRDCYRLDTRTTQLDNFFGRKVEQRLVFSGKERLLSGDMPYMPVPDDLGQKLEAILNLYSKEKAIYYCSFFAVGYGTGMNGRRQRICMPLFLHEAELYKDEDGYAIRIEQEKRMINLDPLAALKKTEEDLRSLISREVPAGTFDFGHITKLQQLLSRHYDGLDTEELLLYPTLSSEKEIKKLYSTKAIIDGGFKIIPAAGIGLVRRSNDTQGIMTELAEMADEQTVLPNSVKALFGAAPQYDRKKEPLGHVPAVLNNAQQRIIENSRKHYLSVAIGPPGTGKSFTIASLAIEFMSRGKSVLIVSKTDQAVDVIEGKIEDDLSIKGATVRAGKSDYLKKLKARMTGILSGFRTADARKFVKTEEKRADDLKWQIKVCNKLINESRKEYEGLLRHEARWGAQLSQGDDTSFFERLRDKYILWLTSLKEPQWLLVEDFMHALNKGTGLIREYIETAFALRIRRSLLQDRKTLRGLLNAIRARTSSKRELLFSQLNFGTMFHAFPIWLSKLADLHKVLPFQSELFDVVIIDEATQCDIASCLPAIYRAKHSVIVGDPKQLRHVSFLSMAAQETLQNKHGLKDLDGSLDYRNQSILDFVDNALASQDQISFLNEHYRSLPDLIHFSNRQFYDGGLSLMNVIPEDHSVSNIDHVELNGTRNKRGFNETEARAILDQLRSIIDEELNLNESICRSIGVLSPFRDQVDYINELLLESLNLEEMQKHDILCGTAHSFQGEERDVMLLSFCLDANSHSTGFNHINRADVFNVSITRAKSRMMVYTSFDLSRLKPNAHLRQYLEEAAKVRQLQRPENEVHDQFLNEVKAVLEDDKYELKTGHEVADLSLDMVIIYKGKMTAIDLIGYPGIYEEGLSLSAYKVLHRVGISTFPMPYTYWRLDREKCEQALRQFLDRNLEA